jgi:hypothetical protein
MSTLWLGQILLAFSFNSDQGSKVTFNDVCISLGMNGNVIQGSGPNTWVMYLNDAAITRSISARRKILLSRFGKLVPGRSKALLERIPMCSHGNGEHQRTVSAVGRLVAEGDGT